MAAPPARHRFELAMPCAELGLCSFPARAAGHLQLAGRNPALVPMVLGSFLSLLKRAPQLPMAVVHPPAPPSQRPLLHLLP
ncbi:hypothetical protein Zm00014a_005671 [Zea mays]|uniref:Uncharacterized protein n=1 Tax=Zea mays TaxID=4577 RepID=A0A3L6GD25_MAIZE|nr:hypothetical protein Zm00014a_005671 [Zea mays]